MIIGAMDLTAVVLAGGKSSRYGSDKALAVVGGRCMIDCVADTVRATMACASSERASSSASSAASVINGISHAIANSQEVCMADKAA